MQLYFSGSSAVCICTVHNVVNSTRIHVAALVLLRNMSSQAILLCVKVSRRPCTVYGISLPDAHLEVDALDTHRGSQDADGYSVYLRVHSCPCTTLTVSALTWVSSGIFHKIRSSDAVGEHNVIVTLEDYTLCCFCGRLNGSRTHRHRHAARRSFMPHPGMQDNRNTLLYVYSREN
jgi:hypothetical protein